MRTLLEIGLSNAVVVVFLALIAAAAGRILRRPALTHCLWLLVLIKLVTPPLFLVSLPVNLVHHEASSPAPREAAPPAQSESPAPSPPIRSEPPTPPDPEVVARLLAETEAALKSPAPQPESEPAVPGEPIWPATLAAIWFGGTLLFFGIAGWQVYRFRRLLRFAQPAPPELRTLANTVACQLGLSRCPPLALVPGAVSPMLWALGGATRLLLPRSLLNRLDNDQRATLIAHELAHWRRRDHWVRLFELVVTGLYWWHPVVWWARWELRETEEQCCDAWVVGSLPQSARPYALALLETVSFLTASRPALPPVASGIGHRHLLQRRLKMIMQCSTPKKLSWLGILAVAGIGLLVLPILPTLAQPPGKDKPSVEPSAVVAVLDDTLVPPGRAIQTIVYSKEYCARCHNATPAVDEKHAHACIYVQAQDEYRAVEARVKELHERLDRLEGRETKAAPMANSLKAYYDLLQAGVGEDKLSARAAAEPAAGADAARDEVALLEVQLKGKQAQVREVEVKLSLALDSAKYMERLGKEASIPQSEVLKSRNDAEVLKAQLDAKRAELAEAELRLAQANRRLKPMQPPPAKPQQPGAQPPPLAGPANAGPGNIKIFSLKNAEATGLGKVLQSVLDGRDVRVIADRRTNSLIAVGDSESMMLLEALIRRLDDSSVSHDAGPTTQVGPGGMKGPGPGGPGTGAPRMPGMGGMGPGGGPGMGGATAKPPTTDPSAAPLRGSGAEPAKTPTTPTAGMPGGMTGGGGMSMMGGKGAPAGATDSERRLKQLEEKLDRLEKLLERMEAERMLKDQADKARERGK